MNETIMHTSDVIVTECKTQCNYVHLQHNNSLTMHLFQHDMTYNSLLEYRKGSPFRRKETQQNNQVYFANTKFEKIQISYIY